MLSNRLIVAILLIPLVILLIQIGGFAYSLFWTIVLAIAGWEYWRMFHQGGYSPSLALIVGGILLICLGRSLFESTHFDIALSLIILATMGYYAVTYENGISTSAVDLGITLGGTIYIGWLGSYLIILRSMPYGAWWLLLVLPAVWFTDLGAYLIGSWLGKNKMCPNLSPRKTIEGYLGGVVFAAVLTLLVALLWQLKEPVIMAWHGLVLGAVIGVISPMGDLGVSMIKRTFQVKDSGNLLPGHGGILDRIDTWLWAGALAYPIINWFF